MKGVTTMAKTKKSVGKKKAKVVSVAFNVSVPKPLLKKINVAARKANLKRSAYVRQQLVAGL